MTTTPSEPTALATQASATFVAARAALVADAARQGRQFCEELTRLTDDWLRTLFEEADPGSGLALVAVGGYGRGDLCPGSDLDVLLVHDLRRGKGRLAGVADRIWYPVWDTNLVLGHAVRTRREALDLAARDMDTATALLDVRLLAGDADLADDLRTEARAAWRKRAGAVSAELIASAHDRATRFGEVAFLLEPDLKVGRGGLRDVHTYGWLATAYPDLLGEDAAGLDAAHDELLTARVALHRVTGRRGDVLTLQDQDAVAAALGGGDADALLGRVSEAARTVAWVLDDAVITVQRGSRAATSMPAHAVVGERGVVRLGDVVALDATHDVGADPGVVLRLAAVAAEAAAEGARLDRASLRRLAAELPTFDGPWPAGARDDLVRVLCAGPGARAVLESLDRFGLLVRVLPEWEHVRCRPQRNALHRFTVDRHLVEAALGAAASAAHVARPDLLVLGALLHDIGKGLPGDHTDTGMALIERVGPRLGLPPEDVTVLVDLCRHHLLLPAVATRRDLDDEATITSVADAVGSVQFLELLAALSEADGLATGPAAWSPWKAELVADLVGRVRHVLEGGSPVAVAARPFPSAAQLAALRAGRAMVSGEHDELTVVARDRPGLFSRVAGVLAIHGLDVISAGALSSDEGWALEHFVVSRGSTTLLREIDWTRVAHDVELALAGRLAVAARVAARAQRYRPRAKSLPVPPIRVTFDDTPSAATVLEVSAPDGVGALYHLTRALAELELDLRLAKIETLGDTVVDAFYLVDADGACITDPEHRKEIERAVLHALDPG